MQNLIEVDLFTKFVYIQYISLDYALSTSICLSLSLFRPHYCCLASLRSLETLCLSFRLKSSSRLTALRSSMLQLLMLRTVFEMSSSVISILVRDSRSSRRWRLANSSRYRNRWYETVGFDCFSSSMAICCCSVASCLPSVDRATCSMAYMQPIEATCRGLAGSTCTWRTWAPKRRLFGCQVRQL